MKLATFIRKLLGMWIRLIRPVAAMFGFLPFAVKDMLTAIAWIGVLVGLAVGVVSIAPIDQKLVWPISLLDSQRSPGASP
jgi:type III secretory pathway component EscT